MVLAQKGLCDNRSGRWLTALNGEDMMCGFLSMVLDGLEGGVCTIGEMFACGSKIKFLEGRKSVRLGVEIQQRVPTDGKVRLSALSQGNIARGAVPTR
jgi:hypothetical protein